MKKTSNYIFNVANTFGFQVLAMGFAFLNSIVLARILGPSGKGIVTVFLLIPNLIAMLLSMSVDESNIYFVSKGISRKQVEVISLLYTGFASVICFLFYFLYSGIFLSIFKGISEHLMDLAIVLVPLFLAFRMLIGILLGMNEVFTYNFMRFLGVFILFIAYVISMIILKLSVKGAVVSIAAYIILIVLIVFVILMLKKTKRKEKKMPFKQLSGKMLKFGIKSYPGITMNFFNKRLDVLVLNYFSGAYDVGIYSVSTVVAELLWHISEAISIPLFPKTAMTEKGKAAQFTTTVLRYNFWILIVSGIVLAIFARIFIRLFWGRAFMDAVVPLLILLPGIVMLGMAKVLGAFFQGSGRPEYGSMFTFVSVVFTIGLDFLLIPSMKVKGAAIASTVAYFVSGFFALYLFKRFTGIEVFVKILIPPFKEFMQYLHSRRN